MLCSEEERLKIIAEIHSISNKVAQEQYLERLKQIIHEIHEVTGLDLTAKLVPKKIKV
jgi:hypothetical protein